MLMPIYGSSQGRTIDADALPIFRLGAAAVLLFVVLIILWTSIAYVPTGHVGVLTLFGRVTGDVLGEGVHLVNPFKVNNTMSVRTLEVKETASVPSNEGLIMTMDTSLLFHLNPAKAAEVYQKLGPRYSDSIVDPSLRSAIREVTASHSANALYSGERDKVAQEIFDRLNVDMVPRGVAIEKILLRDIQLPLSLKQSIEAKQQAEQEALAMSFRLQRERQEAERKRIEAGGIRDFQQVVTQGISPALLEWKGIEATETLAKSANTKIVVIGNSKNGLPLILGQER